MDAQKACEAAEAACQAARAEAARLKEELALAQAQLQTPADANAEPARPQGPKVKRMIAQLEVRSPSNSASEQASRRCSSRVICNAPLTAACVTGFLPVTPAWQCMLRALCSVAEDLCSLQEASAMLHRPTIMTVPDTPPNDTCTVSSMVVYLRTCCLLQCMARLLADEIWKTEARPCCCRSRQRWRWPGSPTRSACVTIAVCRRSCRYSEVLRSCLPRLGCTPSL